jgi:hypothetical protein
MAFPNVSDIIATTIEQRSRKVADNVTKNNAILTRLNSRGNVRPFGGGRIIYEELSFAENGNAGWYSGYDLLPVAAQDVISAAQYDIKQAACPVTISGLEMLQNSGKEAFIDLLEARLNVAESTMANLVAGGLYSTGAGSGGKQITGLGAAVVIAPTGAGTYGGIDQVAYPFWQNKALDSANTTTLLADINSVWAQLIRGMDRPDLIMCDNVFWSAYVALLQAQQRFTQANTGEYGFPSLKYMDADVVLDGGIGGFCPAGTAFFLNTKYLFLRPHRDRNFVALNPQKRYAINQDAEVQIMGWAGNLTCSGRQFQGRYNCN